ncbi:MAG: hypothetical protein ACIAQU_04235 [Phycisphaerales bacterium JB064]
MIYAILGYLAIGSVIYLWASAAAKRHGIGPFTVGREARIWLQCTMIWPVFVVMAAYAYANR